MTTLLIVSGVGSVFFSVTDFATLVCPRATLPNDRDVGESVCANDGDAAIMNRQNRSRARVIVATPRACETRAVEENSAGATITRASTGWRFPPGLRRVTNQTERFFEGANPRLRARMGNEADSIGDLSSPRDQRAPVRCL